MHTLTQDIENSFRMDEGPDEFLLFHPFPLLDTCCSYLTKENSNFSHMKLLIDRSSSFSCEVGAFDGGGRTQYLFRVEEI